jgi:2-dehydropantoate 2-reductase
MKICIIGAGAIGGMLGAKLSLAGEDVTFVEPNASRTTAAKKSSRAVSR